jgi:nitroimidazol reductase NimA-like FMN-containing flavoprotein (pyridoxamine 5'-phosphate oxidase superfamily)
MELDAQGLEVLSPEQCLRLMRRRIIGRVVVDIDGLPSAFPVNFALWDDDVVFRSAAGTKLSVALEGHVVGFQVDRVDPVLQSGWSVLLHGTAELMTDPDDIQRARRLGLRPVAPGERPHVVRIHNERISGRRFVPPAHSLAATFRDAGEAGEDVRTLRTAKRP